MIVKFLLFWIQTFIGSSWSCVNLGSGDLYFAIFWLFMLILQPAFSLTSLAPDVAFIC